MKTLKIAVIDFETTGIDAKRDEVLQVAIITPDEEFCEYCFPLFHNSWTQAQAVHGITPAMVTNTQPFKLLQKDITDLLNESNIVLAYNAAFEIKFLNSYDFKLRHKTFIDPMLMFAKVYGQWNDYRQDYRWQTLATAAKYYGYEFKTHDALEDVRATLYVYNKMIASGISPVYVPVHKAVELC